MRLRPDGVPEFAERRNKQLGDEGYDNGGGVAVQVLAAEVIHGGGAAIGMTSRAMRESPFSLHFSSG
jgi:hypothetical protein